MVAGLKFLSKKGFNPANLTNQKAVWEARQQKEQENKRIKEREDQLRRERDDEELARARGGDRSGDQATLKFMYAPPPGLEAPENAGNNKSEVSNATTNNTNNLMVERQPGDDDAAAAFRQMLAAAATTFSAEQDESSREQLSEKQNASSSSGAALSGTTIEKDLPTDKELSALEKAVGRRDANSSLTLQEQIARFPQLKNAPMAKGMSNTNVGVTFKPLGTQLRNVRCMVCGIWGHSRGDRECQVSGWDPFSSSHRPAAATSILPDPTAQNATMQQDGTMENAKRRARDDSSERSSDSEDSYRRRKRRRKHKKSKRKRRSSSPDEERKASSHKRRKKHSRHD